MEHFWLGRNFLVSLLGLILCYSKTRTSNASIHYVQTCPNPVAPRNFVVSRMAEPRVYDKADGEVYDVREYQENDRVHFHCKDGYTALSDAIMYITCGKDGTWFPDARKIGRCLPNRHLGDCSNKNMFSCRASRKCIPLSKRCDCISDCGDDSDEIECDIRRRIIVARSSGRDSAGVITNPGYPRFYPGNFSCLYSIHTDARHRVQVTFEEFELRPKENGRCVDFVRISGLNPRYLRELSYVTNIVEEQSLDMSETRCGSDMFPLLMSNGSQLSIEVQLSSNSALRLRGMSLVWQVRSSEEPIPVNGEDARLVTTALPSPDGGGLYTVLTPIAIAAGMPLSLILVLYCHRRLRRLGKDGIMYCLRSRKPENSFVDDCVDVKPLTVQNVAHYNDELGRWTGVRELRILAAYELPKEGLDCRIACENGAHSKQSAAGDVGKSPDFLPVNVTNVRSYDKKPLGWFFKPPRTLSRSLENVAPRDVRHVAGMSPPMLRASPVGMSSTSSYQKRSMISRISGGRAANPGSNFKPCSSHLSRLRDQDALDQKGRQDCSSYWRSCQNPPSAVCVEKVPSIESSHFSYRTSMRSVSSSKSAGREDSLNFGKNFIC